MTHSIRGVRSLRHVGNNNQANEPRLSTVGDRPGRRAWEVEHSIFRARCYSVKRPHSTNGNQPVTENGKGSHFVSHRCFVPRRRGLRSVRGDGFLVGNALSRQVYCRGFHCRLSALQTFSVSIRFMLRTSTTQGAHSFRLLTTLHRGSSSHQSLL